VPIEQIRLRNPLNVNISFSTDFLGLEACIAAGLDVEKWDNPNPPPEGYSRKLKARVIARYQLHDLINAHIGDTQIEQQKKEAAKSKRK
jgi:hypothetical protein